MAILLDGRKVAEAILRPVRQQVLDLKKKKIVPCLAIILVGEEPESLIYIRQKVKKAEEIGVRVRVFKFSEQTTETEIEKLLEKLNKNPKIHGIMVQLPLPSHLNPDEILSAIVPEKDVDGLTPHSFYPPACAAGIMKILEFYRLSVNNKKVVILGYGRVVGKPLFKLMKEAGAKVATADIKDVDVLRSADVLVGALPIKDVIKPEMVKRGVIVIDAAKNVSVGVEKVASYLTPKIGGVGPMTVAMLLKNLVRASQRQQLKHRP
uniref:Bifunctional protein FolD n=1 Tax=candidate division CPR3 bacterium TaxID=2268181 RepID=A0A7V3JAB1_UNCC3